MIFFVEASEIKINTAQLNFIEYGLETYDFSYWPKNFSQCFL